MTTQNKKIPQLRFPEFNGEWEKKLLGEIGEFLKGKSIAIKDIEEEGKTPCIRYGELYTTYNEYISDIESYTNLNPKNLVFSKKNDVIIPSSGETHIDIATASCVSLDNIALGGDLNIIRPQKALGVFLAYNLNNKQKIKIASLAQGSPVVHLYNTQLKSLVLLLPTLAEQEKIAEFLSAVESRVQKLGEKLEALKRYKKGVMQQIFSQEIRFKDDRGNPFPNWEKKKLGEIFNVLRGHGLPKSEIKDNGIFQAIHYGELFTKYKEVIDCVFSSTDLNGKTKSSKGDILMPSSDVTPDGLATASTLLLHNVILGSDINVLRKKKDNINSIFMSFQINSNKKSIMRLVTGTTVKHIYPSDIKKIKLYLPTLPEQKKIANFLSSIDKKIELTQQELEHTECYKKGLLQRMFV